MSKYLTQKVRNIVSICIIIIGIFFMCNYAFNRPTYVNKYIATKIYKEPANNAFTDQNFYNCVIDAYNKENNTNLPYTTNLSNSQLVTITKLMCGDKEINNVNGIEKLVALSELNIYDNQLITLDLSKNTSLISLFADHNKIADLDISRNKDLRTLFITDNQLTSLDLTANTSLKNLDLGGNQLTSLDLSESNALEHINVCDNQLYSLNISNALNLKYLDIYNNHLTSFDVSKYTMLSSLNAGRNQLYTLDVSKNTNLFNLQLYGNYLTSLDVSKNTMLFSLNVGSNQLHKLDVSNNVALTNLDVGNNRLTALNVSKNLELQNLNVSNNKLVTLDLSNNLKLNNLNLNYNSFKNNAYVYKNDELNLANYAIKLATGKNSNIINVANMDDSITFLDGMIVARKPGKYTIKKAKIHQDIGDYNEYTMSFDLYVIEATSDKYIINEDEKYIYTGSDTDKNIIKENITLNYGVGSIENNKYVIKADNREQASYDLLRISTEYMTINNMMIVLDDYGNNENILSKVMCHGCDLEIANNQLLIKYNNEIIVSYVLMNMLPYVTSDTLLFNNDKMVIYNLNNSLSISSLLEQVESNGEINVLDKDGNAIDSTANVRTGYILRTVFDINLDGRIDYKLSVKGDVIGDGNISYEDAKKISRHVISGNIINGDEYLLAADYDGNGTIKMNDVTKMLKEKLK